MTNGSGWPAGSSILEADAGFRNLKFEAITVEGGKSVAVALPRGTSKVGTSVLQAVVASKVWRRSPLEMMVHRRPERNKRISRLLWFPG
jgi:hypothetical protein